MAEKAAKKKGMVGRAGAAARGILGAGVEIPLMLGTGAIAEVLPQAINIMGAAGEVSPEDAKIAKERLRGALTYTPRTEGGQAAARGIGQALSYIPKAIEKIPGGADAMQWGKGVAERHPRDMMGLEALLSVAPIPMRAKPGATAAESLVAKAARRGELLPDEVSALAGGKPHVNRSRAASFAEYRNSFSDAELAELAKAGWAKRGWYQNSANALRDMLGEQDSKRFALLLAALSPQTSVESNLRNTVKTWQNWVSAGRPDDPKTILDIMGRSVEGTKAEQSVLDAWRNNSFRALSAKDVKDIQLSGPKVSSFAENLVGNLGEVTNDTWMARALGTSQTQISGAKVGADEIASITGKNPAYIAASAAQRSAAEMLTKELGIEISPAEIQETVWSALKSGWEKRAATQGGDMSHILGTLDDAEVLGTPDFSTLLRDTPEYRTALEASGARFDKLSPHIDPGQRPPSDPAMLEHVGRKMEKRFRNETRPGALGFLIKNEGALNIPEPAMMKVAGKRTQASPFLFSNAARGQLANVGLPAPESLRLLDDTPENHQLFVDAMTRRVANNPDPTMRSVDIPQPNDLAGSRLVLDESGRAGFTVAPGGNLGNLFNVGGPKGMGMVGPALGVKLGGTHLDAFDTRLPRMYSQAGFRPVGKLAFDTDYAPPGWDYKKMDPFNEGKPDLTFMTYNPNPRPGSEVLGAGVDPYDFAAPFTYPKSRKLLESYDEGKAAQRESLKSTIGEGTDSPWRAPDPAPWIGNLDRGYLNADDQLDAILGITKKIEPKKKRAR